jgi:hypothetical protein
MTQATWSSKRMTGLGGYYVIINTTTGQEYIGSNNRTQIYLWKSDADGTADYLNRNGYTGL